MSDEKALTPQQTFQENIRNKLLEDIGSLIPPDALAELVEKAIHDLFFEKRTRQLGYRSEETVVSWFEEEIAKQLKADISKHCYDWLEKNHEAVEEKLVKAIEATWPHLLGAAFVGILTNRLSQSTFDIEEALRRAGIQLP